MCTAVDCRRETKGPHFGTQRNSGWGYHKDSPSMC